MNAPLFTFVLCAYKESAFIEEAIVSAERQTLPVRLVMATSTPSTYLRKVAEKHGIDCVVNPESKGIAADWNFALKQIETPYGCIMHQDDVYFPQYAEKVVQAMKKHPESLIVFPDYCDLLSDGKYHPHRLYLEIKRLLLWAFYLKHCHRSRFWKRSALVFGNAVACPAVSYNMAKLGTLEFDTAFSVNLDWAQWLALSEREGAFVFIPRILMAHRIADAQETAAAIADNRRYNEDFRIFEMIWGTKAARFLMRFYKKAYTANRG